MKIISLLILSFIFLNAKVEYAKYCSDNILRETNIIIDLNNIDNTLYGKIIQNLKYLPHEKVNIFYYDNKKDSIVKSYTFCYPKLTKAEIQKIKSGSLISKAFGTKIDQANDDQMFIKSKITTRLAHMRKAIGHQSHSNFKNALGSLSDDLTKYSRILIVTNEDFNSKLANVDLKYAKVKIVRTKFPKKKILEQDRNYFLNCNSYLNSIYTRLPHQQDIDTLRYADANFNIFINHKRRKAQVFALVDNNNKIVNGWLNIYGILKVPLKGTAQIKDNKIVLLNATIPNKFKYNHNIIYKNDKIKLKYKNHKYIGKYYNNAFAFKQKRFEYFKYEVK